MLQQSGDVHHIVPKDYLQKNGFPDRSDYNQVGNYVLTETSINISIGNASPVDYMAQVADQIQTGALALGEITDQEDLSANLNENAVTQGLSAVTARSYPEFLIERRRLMAAAMRAYYERL